MSAGDEYVYGGVTLRLGTVGDIPVIEGIVGEAVPLMRAGGNFQWGDDYPTREHFTRDIELSQLWVCLDGGELIGVGALTEDQGEDYKQLWDISIKAVVPHRVCVSPKARGKGAAKAFMMHAETLSRQRGYASVRVDTNSQNAAMHHIFDGLGYKFLGDLALAGRENMTFHGFEKFLNT